MRVSASNLQRENERLVETGALFLSFGRPTPVQFRMHRGGLLGPWGGGLGGGAED